MKTSAELLMFIPFQLHVCAHVTKKYQKMIHVFCRSDLSKDQMIVDLSFKTKLLFWSGILLGSMSVGIIGYAVVRYVGFEFR